MAQTLCAADARLDDKRAALLADRKSCGGATASAQRWLGMSTNQQ
jgi:hypothetical protein